MNPSTNKPLPPRWDETWYIATRTMDIWITPPDHAPYHPDITIIYILDSDVIQAMTISEPDPEPNTIQDLLRQAIYEPSSGVEDHPHRPEKILAENEFLFSSLVEMAEKLDFHITLQSIPALLDEVLDGFTRELSVPADQMIPGLLANEEITPALVKDLFSAAGKFYLAAPWNYLDNLQTLAIQLPGETSPRIAAVMGYAGMEYGLNIYQSWEDYKTIVHYSDISAGHFPDHDFLIVSFDHAGYLPPDDLEAIQRHSWEVVNQQNYPIPMVFTSQNQLRRPDRQELIYLEAALKAIPVFIKEYLEGDIPGDYPPARATIPIDGHEGRIEVRLTFPAGHISPGDLPSSFPPWEEELDPNNLPGEVEFMDPRAWEGDLGRFGGHTTPDNPLAEAQEVMYKAWDENNPATRLILARQALSITPDCADAYVLLAEEESSTRKEALNLYQQGVKAGERALGEDFFKKNRGYFWGLVETRPYMRAREGLARTLWEMGEDQEALSHYREMLSLNPMDNQGIRYTLLSLLLETNRGEEADHLLIEFEDDASAEWLFNKALRLFQKGGATKKASRALQEAVHYNPHIPNYLAGQVRIPHALPMRIILGEESEAVNYAAMHLSIWRQTPGALEWLKKES